MRDRPPSAEVPIGVLEIPVGVWGSRRIESISGLPGRLEVFSEETCTVIVFPHGAVIRLSMAIEPGQPMMVANRKSGRQIFCRVVNVRKFPSARGYAEIEFIQPADAFWGPYIPQGTMRLKEQAKLPTTKLEKPLTPASIAPDLAPIHPSMETSPAPFPKSFGAAPRPLENFYSSGIPPELSAVATTAAASPDFPTKVRAKSEPVAPCRVQTAKEGVKSTNEHSAFPWVWGLLGSSLNLRIHIQSTKDGVHSSRRTMALVGATVACFCLICALWILLPRFRSARSDGVAQTSPTLPSSNLQDLQSESSSEPVVPLPTLAATTDNFPGTQNRKFAEDVTKVRPPARKVFSEGEITNRRLLVPRWTAGSARAGQVTPPEIPALSPNSGKDPVEFLVDSPAVGGRVKEPQLVLKMVPTYPAAARQYGIEGDVTVDAVINTDGKLTNMSVVSGPPLLQQAALESLRNWKYRPAYVDDKPVPAKTSVTVKFRLR